MLLACCISELVVLVIGVDSAAAAPNPMAVTLDSSNRKSRNIPNCQKRSAHGCKVTENRAYIGSRIISYQNVDAKINCPAVVAQHLIYETSMPRARSFVKEI